MSPIQKQTAIDSGEENCACLSCQRFLRGVCNFDFVGTKNTTKTTCMLGDVSWFCLSKTPNRFSSWEKKMCDDAAE